MYTYAFLHRTATDLVLPQGIAGNLQFLATHQIAAVVEPDLAFEAFQTSDNRLMQAVLSHDRVLRALFDQTVVLPLRFGTLFVSREGLLEHLETAESFYREKLKELDGKAEYTLKLLPRELTEVAIPAEATGRAYFLAKKQRYQTLAEQQQQQQEELKQVQQAIAQLYPDLVYSEPQEGVERLHLLTARQSEPLLSQHLQNWQAQCPHWDLSLGEALPPYHFV